VSLVEERLRTLDPVFSYARARRAGLSKRAIYRLRDQGLIEPVGRGIYRRADAPPADLDLLEIVARAPRATLCLPTALARHGLCDLLPAAVDVALPRGARAPVVGVPVAWHRFAPETFDIGRDTVPVDGQALIGLYSPTRCIIDAFRLRDREGTDLAHEALRRWLRRRGCAPADLMRMADHFPRTKPALRHALDVLL
jgi:predicted transcriptional regulator of viral defense system